jgi:hypothetical protein
MAAIMKTEECVLLGIPAKDIEVDETCPYTAKLGGIPVRIFLYFARNPFSLLGVV